MQDLRPVLVLIIQSIYLHRWEFPKRGVAFNRLWSMRTHGMNKSHDTTQGCSATLQFIKGEQNRADWHELTMEQNQRSRDLAHRHQILAEKQPADDRQSR